MRYRVVVVPALRTIRQSTLDLLAQLQAAGGTVLWLGEPPSALHGEPSPEPARIASQGTQLSATVADAVRALEPWRMIDATTADGQRPSDLLYQWRDDGDVQRLFICTTMTAKAMPAEETVTLRLAGRWQVTEHDTLSGTSAAIGARVTGSHTTITFIRRHAASLLLTLTPDPRTAGR